MFISQCITSTLPFAALYHLPRRIPRPNRLCACGSITVGRVVVSFAHQQRVRHTWWIGGGRSMEAKAGGNADPVGEEEHAVADESTADEAVAADESAPDTAMTSDEEVAASESKAAEAEEVAQPEVANEALHGYDDMHEIRNLRRTLTDVDLQYAAQPEQSRRIHILGTGNIGKLVAHSLRGIASPPPITLIFHRYRLLEAWQQSKKVITIQDGDFKVPRDGFDVELKADIRREHRVTLEDGQPSVFDFPDEFRPHEAAKILAQQQKENAAHAKERPPPVPRGASAAPIITPRPDSDKPKPKTGPSPGDLFISNDPIHNLIVTTKAALTVSALSAIAHRLLPTSTICFLQNGMGILDDVNKELFPDEATRPNYVQGIITHGVNAPPEAAEIDPFFAVHAGHGTIALGLLPRAGVKLSTDADGRETRIVVPEQWAPSARAFMRTITRTPVLQAVGFTPTELLQLQLEKLAVNSVLNPLTTLVDARNGCLTTNMALTRTMRLLLAETSLVIRSLPELQHVPNLNIRFSPERLGNICISIAETTRDNISSMLADVRGGRRTEIEYINGYIVRRGEEVGIQCVVNYAIMQTVLGKAIVAQREAVEDLPLAGSLNR
ncbi:hypothetical protein LTR08_001181 [Meristemomyces frigidus]|nr:hypothetical protein LTR08_001181 [Meristemomyces frigidus]